MSDFDRSYYVKHALGADPELEWGDTYINEYRYDEDEPFISLDDNIVFDFDDEHLGGDSPY